MSKKKKENIIQIIAILLYLKIPDMLPNIPIYDRDSPFTLYKAHVLVELCDFYQNSCN